MNYQVKVLSPVHIGTGKKITPFEFVITDHRFIVIDMNKVIEANPQRADDLNSRLALDAMRFSLSAFLTPEEKTNSYFRKYSASLDETTKAVLHEEIHKAKDMDVDECIKTITDPQIYIPGSSLKGALRTALAYSTFQADTRLFGMLKDRLNTVNWRRSDEAVNELIFWGARNDPKYDLFRTLHISDSSPLPADETTLEIGKMKILSITAPQKKEPEKHGTMFKQLQQLKSTMTFSTPSPMKPWWTMQETLKPGLIFTGNFTIDNNLLTSNAVKKLRWKAHQHSFDPQRLLLAANSFAKDICDWELNFFEQLVTGIDVSSVLTFYSKLKTQIERADEHTCYLCIGQGAGWNKMTIGTLLERDTSFDFRKLRKELRLAHYRLNFEYPKSRKMLMKSDEEIQAVFGWVEIRLS